VRYRQLRSLVHHRRFPFLAATQSYDLRDDTEGHLGKGSHWHVDPSRALDQIEFFRRNPSVPEIFVYLLESLFTGYQTQINWRQRQERFNCLIVPVSVGRDYRVALPGAPQFFRLPPNENHVPSPT